MLLEPGKIFFSKWLKYSGTQRHIPIHVRSVDPAKDIVVVDYGAGSGPDEWILSHCEAAFKNGEYSFLTFDANLYELSKDYDLLYKFVCSGYKVACFVNYKWYDGDVIRDICECQKNREWNITFRARGIEYGGIYREEKSETTTEKDAFLIRCAALNVEFIPAVDPYLLAKTSPDQLYYFANAVVESTDADTVKSIRIADNIVVTYETQPTPKEVEKFKEILDYFKNNANVKFGLVAQGKIPIIEEILAEYGTSKYAWEKIGAEIGWEPLTAAAHYIRYLKSKSRTEL